MANIYLNNYGVTFGDKHSLRDFRLYPRMKPIISAPEPKLNMVDIPGADNSLDLTENLTGFVQYEMRDATFEYIIVEPRSQWDAIISNVMDSIHGQRMHVILDEAPDGYYDGRLTVSNIDFDRRGAAYVTISGTFDAYKYEINTTYEDWLWNPFNFENGVIREYKNISVSDGDRVFIVGSRMPVTPIFNASGAMNMVYDSNIYELKSGDNRFPEIVIGEGEHEFIFMDSGTVTIKFRGGHF